VAEDRNRRKEGKAEESTKSIPRPSLDERNIWRSEWNRNREKKIRIGDNPIPSNRLGSYRLQSRQMISGEERKKNN